MPLWQLVLQRLLQSIPTLALVSLISFTLMRFDFELPEISVPMGEKPFVLMHKIHIKTPVDPLAELRQNPQISRAEYLAEQQRLGLDKPFLVQYGLWLKNSLHLNPQKLFSLTPWQVFQPNLGLSFNGEPVTKLIAQRLPATLLLNVISLVVTWMIALPLGITAALHWRKPVDNTMMLLSSVTMGLPTFILALLFALIAVKTGVLPVGGLVSASAELWPWYKKIGDVVLHLILPVSVLTIVSVASLQRQMRGNLLEVLGANYVRMARAKGLPENKVIYKHALRTAINPMLTLLGFEFAGLFSGAALVEMILRYPGIGSLALDAVRQTDTNLVMVILLLGAFMLVMGNLFADILLRIADPRIADASTAAGEA